MIDADALIAKLKTQYGEDLGWQCTVNMSDVGMMVEDAPTVDAVEVVRCKGCKHYRWQGHTSLLVNGKNVKAGWCHRRIRHDEEYRMLPDDFCSYGERKVSADEL